MSSASRTRAPSSSSAGPQSVGRVISILERLAAQRDGATLTELASFTDAPKTSLVGLLNAMVAERCLRREPTGRYVLGERVYAFVAQAGEGQDLSKLAQPVLRDLVDATGETAVLGVVADDADLVVYIDKVESDNPVRYTVKVGERREMHCTAMGKVLLAYSDPDRIRRMSSARALKRFTSTTITSPSRFRAELDRIRDEGIARTSGERVAGANGFAAPVFGPDGRAIAALLVAGPSNRVQVNQALIEHQLIEGARRLSLALGGRAHGGALGAAPDLPGRKARVKNRKN